MMVFKVRAWAVAAALIGLSWSDAGAGDKPLVAPPPAWAKPPLAPTSLDPQTAGLPVVVVLNDTELDFDTEGWSEFHLVQAKIQTQTGLQALGAIPFAWAPYSDTLTIHSARILRDGAAIDVMPKDGAFTVLRREPGLESALLTGELTAVLQPEGLQVGDVLEFSATIRHAEPLLKAIPSALMAGWDQAVVRRFRLSARWPASMPMRWAETPGLPPLVRTEADGKVMAVLELDNVHPLIAPANAPIRFRHGRQVEFSAASSWQDIADVMAPLYEAAAKVTPGSPLAAKIDEIARNSSDPKARASMALAMVEDQVRYLAHADQDRGYTPQSAEDTWRLRYGDCKAKTSLLLAILRQLGVKAEPVLANSSFGDAINGRLPSAGLFNHVLLRTTIGGQVYWLDGTRTGDANIDQLEIPALGWVLPLETRPTGLVQLGPPPPAQPQVSHLIRYDATKGLSAPMGTHLETVLRGDAGYVLHLAFSAQAGDQYQATLKAFWATQHSAFVPTSMSEHWDPATREETVIGDGTSKLDWTGSGLELQHVEFGGKPDIERDPAATDPDAPYLTAYPLFTTVDEGVLLPPGNRMTAKIISAIDENVEIGGVAYHRKGSYADNLVRVALSTRTLKPEISAAEARASADPLTKIGENGVYIPANAVSNAAADAVTIDTAPTSASGRITRGNALLNKGRYSEAKADFDAAIALDPSSQRAYADRAVARAWLSDPGAADDIEKAEALGGPDPVSIHARGILAEQAGKLQEAKTQYRRALAINPKDQFSVWRLFMVDLRELDLTAAKSDLAALHDVAPEYLDNAYVQLAETVRKAPDPKKFVTEATPLIPEDTAGGLYARALMHLAAGPFELALGEIDASLKLKPSVDSWILKANIDESRNPSRVDADYDEALKLDPNSARIIYQQLVRAERKKDYQAALGFAERIVASHPEDRAEALVQRARLRHKLGQDEGAGADFAEARAITGTAAANPYRLCLAETEARWRPDLAIGDCERAIKAGPRSGELLLDHALLLHRLGRDGEVRGALAGVEQTGLDPYQLNNLCYGMARENVALDRALELCDAAVKASPSASHLDSRAFVLLRLGRDADALTAYNAAIEMNDGLAAARFGRGVVEARLGRLSESERDIAAAEKVSPGIRKTFADMGVAPP